MKSESVFEILQNSKWSENSVEIYGFLTIWQDDDEAGSDENWKLFRDADFDAEEDMDYEEESLKNYQLNHLELMSWLQYGHYFLSHICGFSLFSAQN